MPLSILLVDDEPDLLEALAESLSEEGHMVTTAVDGAQALSHLGTTVFDVVLTDINLPKADGMTLLRTVQLEAPSTRVIIMTAYGDIAHAVAALREGAYDYLSKPFDLDKLIVQLQHVAEQGALRKELAQARAALAGRAPETLLIGQSPPIRRVMEMVDMVARSNAPTLITGESGTGKELVARMIHDRSPRHDKTYVAVNCGALTETLMEAELFGHERGAFTGADRKREGRFKAADGGTLFLDEVAELPLSAQAKLLRVLQEGTFEPLGSNTPIKVDVRVVSATHRNLRERIHGGLFREDLFYRINVIEIPLPPLRERPGDLLLLVQHFLERFTPKGTPVPSIAPSVWAALSQHPFPGNVRELSHAIQHAVVLSGGGQIGLGHLPPGIVPSNVLRPTSETLNGDKKASTLPLSEAVWQFEREYLLGVLAATQGKRAEAAAILGISRKSLWEKLRGSEVARHKTPAP